MSDPNKLPAHTLWVELSTRIATQRLHYRSGDEESAVASVHKLFVLTRELMEKNPDAKEFQKLALALVNRTLRPCTAGWHGWLTEADTDRDKDGKPQLKFCDEWVRRQFRRELRTLQPLLVGFMNAFEALKDKDWLEAPAGLIKYGIIGILGDQPNCCGYSARCAP